MALHGFGWAGRPACQHGQHSRRAHLRHRRLAIARTAPARPAAGPVRPGAAGGGERRTIPGPQPRPGLVPDGRSPGGRPQSPTVPPSDASEPSIGRTTNWGKAPPGPAQAGPGGGPQRQRRLADPPNAGNLDHSRLGAPAVARHAARRVALGCVQRFGPGYRRRTATSAPKAFRCPQKATTPGPGGWR